VIAGAEPVLLAGDPALGGLPALDALTPAFLARTALLYLCTPSNPEGTVASLDYLKSLITLARAHDVVLAIDECYAEIYDRDPPPGALEACAALGGAADNVLVFHSLSKRSSAPGLRSGFVAGDPRIVAALLRVMDFGAAGIPLPIMAASAALWSDDTHVEPIRAAYRANFTLAERSLGNRFGFRRPAGGFFLWLDVGDGEAAAKRLWQEAGLRSLPGAYLAATDANGVNPGAPFLRVAMVHDAAMTASILERMGTVL
jgi:aspartate/methionine/tyrosine aminotransferase